MPNHQPNAVIHTTNKTSIHTAKTNLKTEKGNLLCSLFLLLVNVNSSNNPYTPVEITHKLVCTSLEIMSNLFNIVSAKMLATTHRAVGKALDITLCKKFPLIFSLLGSSAKTKEGIPIVTKLIKLS